MAGRFRSAARLGALLLLVRLLAGCASYPSHAPTAAPVMALSATSVNFSNVIVGQSATQTLTISNSGNAPLDINSLSLKSQEFSFTGPSVPRVVLPAQSVAYTLTFAPNTSGNASAALQISTNAASAASSVSLAGVAQKAIDTLQLSPASINFGNLKLQSTGTQNVTLQNTGDVNITLSGVTASGTGFGYSDLSPGFTLSPNQKVTFQVWFKPQTAGPATGKISVLAPNLTSPAQIAVAGDGVTSSTSQPPPPPPAQHTVSLSWNASSSGSIAGYRVYRSVTPGAAFSPLTSTIGDLSYTDSGVSSGSTYYYVVTAVDASGSESLYSNQVTVAIP